MLIEFRLSMPCIGSWNGKWTGENNYYGKIINFTSMYGTGKKAKEKAESILNKSFRYNFGDGWVAEIDVSKVDGRKANSLRKKSRGFMGYEWMIDSILRNGEIFNAAEALRRGIVNG